MSQLTVTIKSKSLPKIAETIKAKLPKEGRGAFVPKEIRNLDAEELEFLNDFVTFIEETSKSTLLEGIQLSAPQFKLISLLYAESKTF